MRCWLPSIPPEPRSFRTPLLTAPSLGLQSFSRREELRVICGTRGIPGTVAPFRAWRGSRDLVAQSPKFHAPAVARIRASAKKILTHSFAGVAQREPAQVRFLVPFPLGVLFQGL